MDKGHFFRLLLSLDNSDKVIAAAKEMQLHLSAQTENSSTKDTTGDFLEYEVVGQTYDITGSGLVLTDDDTLGGNTAAGLDSMLDNIRDEAIDWKICKMGGTNNRTIVETLFSGKAKLTNLQVQAQNKQKAQYSYTLNGYGPIVVASGE